MWPPGCPAITGYQGNISVIVEISDPANPREVGRWWVPGQHTAGGEHPAKPEISLHGPPYVVGDLAYLPYGAAGMIVVDISDVSTPRQVGQLSFSPPFHDRFGVHSVLPLPEQGMAYVSSEDVSYGTGPMAHASIVDIRDPANPFLLAMLPRPVPPLGSGYRDFSERGGWQGPHNLNHLQHNPGVERQGDRLYLAYFNAGLRIFDVVWLKNSAASRRVAIIVAQQPTQALSTPHLTALAPHAWLGCNELVGEPLMRRCQINAS